MAYKLVSPFSPQGDQPRAIDALCRGIEEGRRDQVLLGVTGSGQGVAHFAHLGGMVAGFVLLLRWRRQPRPR